MKKLKLLLIILIVMVVATGCGNKAAKNNKEGKIYNIVVLQDKGINMFYSIVPKGWSASISSQDLVNSSYPFVETVEIKNKDKSASITILSQHSYTENNKYNEGVNKDYYTTYLHEMSAKEYSDYFMQRIYNTNTFVKDVEVDKEIKKQFIKLHDMKIEMGKKDAETLQANSSGVTLNVAGVDATFAKRQYQNGDTYYELFTCVSSISTSLNSSLSPMLSSYAVQWYMPYVIIYQAKDKATFDKYYDDYNFIVANSNFTLDYYAMIEYTSSAIVNAVTAAYAAKSQAALDATNSYIDSNYSSTSSESTNDKVMQMWDDVINEVDEYKLEDGSSFRTSIHNDVVAQRGDEIYVGTKGGIPYGFNQLDKAY